MSLLPNTAPSARQLLAHANDAWTMRMFERALGALIAEFTAVHGRAPVVLSLGCNIGQIVQFSLLAGAHHVVLCDPNAEAQGLASAHLASCGYDETHFTIVTKSPLQLPASEQYDILVHDCFGATSNAGGAAVYVWDLLRRKIVRQHSLPDGSFRRYVIPQESSMTARMYHVPALSADTRFGCVGNRQVSKQQTKIKWQTDSDMLQLVLTKENTQPISERVEVLYETYDELVDSITWPTYIELWPTATHLPADECIILLEWTAVLAGPFVIGTTLECNHDAKTRRARAIAWGHEFVPVSSVSTSLAPIIFAVNHRPAGGVSMSVVGSMPSKDMHSLSNKKLQTIVEATFARAAMS